MVTNFSFLYCIADLLIVEVYHKHNYERHYPDFFGFQTGMKTVLMFL